MKAFAFSLLSLAIVFQVSAADISGSTARDLFTALKVASKNSARTQTKTLGAVVCTKKVILSMPKSQTLYKCSINTEASQTDLKKTYEGLAIEAKRGPMTVGAVNEYKYVGKTVRFAKVRAVRPGVLPKYSVTVGSEE